MQTKASASAGDEAHQVGQAFPPLAPACAAEGIGMFSLVFAGFGAIVINTVSGAQVTHVGIGLVFGLIVAAMIYATGHLSAAHLNPAVTLGFVLARHFPLRRMAAYWLAQIAGAIAPYFACGCCSEMSLTSGRHCHLVLSGNPLRLRRYLPSF
jgi:glycerol uptake facilitator-like aquaporin